MHLAPVGRLDPKWVIAEFDRKLTLLTGSVEFRRKSKRASVAAQFTNSERIVVFAAPSLRKQLAKLMATHEMGDVILDSIFSI